MTLLDTNVIIDARDRRSPFQGRAEELIANALSAGGIAINPIILAELCVGQPDPDSVVADLAAKGVNILDLPARAASICARAYAEYLAARIRGVGPRPPLPDFFIGAHAELMGWTLATRDPARIRMYFPAVEIIEP